MSPSFVRVVKYMGYCMHRDFHTGFLWGNDLLEDQEGDGRITLIRLLGMKVVRMGDGWNWPGILCIGGRALVLPVLNFRALLPQC
jgi:hypothetical protein